MYDFFLQHEVLIFNIDRELQQMKKNGRRDVVRQIANHAQLLCGVSGTGLQRAEIDAQHV